MIFFFTQVLCKISGNTFIPLQENFKLDPFLLKGENLRPSGPEGALVVCQHSLPPLMPFCLLLFFKLEVIHKQQRAELLWLNPCMESPWFPGETKSPQKPNVETSPSCAGLLPALSIQQRWECPTRSHQQPGGGSLSQAGQWAGLRAASSAVWHQCTPTLASTPGLHQTLTAVCKKPARNTPGATSIFSEAHQLEPLFSLMPSTGETLKSRMLPFFACTFRLHSILSSPWCPRHSFPEYHFFSFIQQTKARCRVHSVSLTFCFPTWVAQTPLAKMQISFGLSTFSAVPFQTPA